MSPKKKSATRPASLPKDELIDALLQDEKEEASLSLEDRLSSTTRPTISIVRPPPPPPPSRSQPDGNEAVFSFGEDDQPAGLLPDDDTRPFPEAGAEPAAPARGDSTAPYDFLDPAKLNEAPKLSATIKREGRSSAFDALRIEPKRSESPDKPPVESAAPTPSLDRFTPVAPSALEAPASIELEIESKPPVRASGPDDDKTTPIQSEQERPAMAASPPSKMNQQTSVVQERSQIPSIQDVRTELLPVETRTQVQDDPEGEQFMPTEVRANSPGAKYRDDIKQAQPGAAVFSSAEAALRQSENLRIAQKRISDLERELERVRRENDGLRSAGETLRRRLDELQAKAEASELHAQEARKIAEEEKKVLRGQIVSRDRELSEMKGRIDDAENRLEANFRKIRVRERDLEHRIEIIKAESQSIAASKDRMILELKRQMDQLSSELNHAKAQVQETFGQFKERQETVRRAVRALRIALTVLEGEDAPGTRKAE